jgi:hypothetical protein
MAMEAKGFWTESWVAMHPHLHEHLKRYIPMEFIG